MECYDYLYNINFVIVFVCLTPFVQLFLCDIASICLTLFVQLCLYSIVSICLTLFLQLFLNGFCTVL